MKSHKDCLEEFQEIAEFEAQNRERWLEDLRFGFASDQWDEKLRRARQNNPHGARPCLTVNKIPTHARQILNDMRQARASIKVLPVDDKADVETAEIIQGSIRHIEHVSNADQAYTIAAEYQVMMGVGYFRVNTEYTDPVYNEQEIRIQAIRNPFSVYMDPWCIDITGGDAKSCYVVSQYPKKEFERRWPKAMMADIEKLGPTSASGWFTDNGVRVAEYFWIEEYDEDYVLVNGQAHKADKYDPSLGKVQREAKVARQRVKWHLMTGAEILEEAEKPGEYIPIIRVVGEDYDIDGDRIVHGIVRRARDAQQMYNFTVSSIAERNALEPKAPWLIAEEAVEGHEDEFGAANRENLPFLRYNAFSEDGQPMPAPQRQFPVGANSALINQMQSSDADIQATIGQFAASLGQVSNEKSGAAIRQRQHVGDIATFHYPDNMSRAIRQAGRVIISQIPEVYDTPRIARILGEDGEAEQARLDPEIQGAMEERSDHSKVYNLGVGKYDVAVTTGPSYATKRQEGAERMQAYLQGNPALWGVIGDLAVKLDDGPYSEEMAKRLRATIPPEIRQDEEEAEALPPEAMQQIQQAEQALQEQGMQLEEMGQENQQMKQAIDGKLLEQQMKQQEYEFRQMEMSHEAQIAQLEYELKQQELQVKQLEAQAKLQFQAEKQFNDSQAAQANTEAQQTSSAETNAILLELARATQMQGEMLAAMLQEMAKPKQLAVQTDAAGNIVGGISQTIQ